MKKVWFLLLGFISLDLLVEGCRSSKKERAHTHVVYVEKYKRIGFALRIGELGGDKSFNNPQIRGVKFSGQAINNCKASCSTLFVRPITSKEYNSNWSCKKPGLLEAIVHLLPGRSQSCGRGTDDWFEKVKKHFLSSNSRRIE